eukprot:CAMPEP_0174283932 /NCGR_PEP_ID=MMETSP0809-20121228/4659_1 /TAXON_ID=73025 ORGANISM="Eutreptiella gymnastica-like, Strain CCMP1594" /NCGR_SAMPLE_ID=MMETSP0809 /ASSEMBLY_ACC=CAM_ASM_000658 /LENGTH=105 /DNA_ID=CAMNT_0015379159 /DNA_START=73 /DNA_END=391 /DNA_ORIENTATION=-
MGCIRHSCGIDSCGVAAMYAPQGDPGESDVAKQTVPTAKSFWAESSFCFTAEDKPHTKTQQEAAPREEGVKGGKGAGVCATCMCHILVDKKKNKEGWWCAPTGQF